MTLIFLLGLATVFVVTGHSTLLHFRAQELAVLPVDDVLFPKPRRGVFVSVLCFAVALICVVVAIALIPKGAAGIQSSQRVDALKLFMVFIALPVGCYGTFLARRLRRSEAGRVAFHSAPLSQREAALPLAITGALGLLAMVM